MPKNRPDQTREEKSSVIIAIARRHFLEKGYDGTTIAAIARDTGIATNVVHWYFATKDDLFVAVLDSLQTQDLEEAEERVVRSKPGLTQKELETLLTEFVWRRLDRFGLLATLHDRSHHSAVMAEFHQRAHRRYAESLEHAIANFGIPAAERKLVVDALIGAIEGLVMHNASKRDARRMMTFLAQRLIGGR
jgi:AcrR family transcriptional regulator